MHVNKFQYMLKVSRSWNQIVAAADSPKKLTNEFVFLSWTVVLSWFWDLLTFKSYNSIVWYDLTVWFNHCQNQFLNSWKEKVTSRASTRAELAHLDSSLVGIHKSKIQLCRLKKLEKNFKDVLSTGNLICSIFEKTH